MKYKPPCLALTFIGPHISKWISYNGKDALVAFPNDFLFYFPTRQCSHVDKVTLARLPIRPSLANLVILSCPIWPSLACHIIELLEALLIEVEKTELSLL